MKKNRSIAFLLTLACMVCFSFPGFASQKSAFVPGELLIQPKPWVSEAFIQSAVTRHETAIIDEIAPIKVKRIQVPEQALERVLSALKKNPRFNFVERHPIAEGVYIPNDDKYDSQWHLPQIQSPSGWDLSFGSFSEPIAIIDSGVDPNHSDLSAKLIAGKNFLDGSTDTHDVLGHGTAVAGSAAAVSDNDLGVTGVA